MVLVAPAACHSTDPACTVLVALAACHSMDPAWAAQAGKASGALGASAAWCCTAEVGKGRALVGAAHHTNFSDSA